MSRTNFETLETEMKLLKFDMGMISELEEMMGKGFFSFELKGRTPADKGQFDVKLSFEKQWRSGDYHLVKYDLVLDSAEQLDGDPKYLVITSAAAGKMIVREFDKTAEAVGFFRSQTWRSELAITEQGETDLSKRQTLATMVHGHVDDVLKHFEKFYYTPALSNSFDVAQGRGFTVMQAANMLQGRSVYRDDLVNNEGVIYNAWSQIQFDKPKDRFGNYQLRQYGESYGYDLIQELHGYNIILPEDPKQMEQLLHDLKDGGQPMVPVVNDDNRKVLMKIEAVPGYYNLNFYKADTGEYVDSESLMKEPKWIRGNDHIVDRCWGQVSVRESGKGDTSEQMTI